MKIAVIGAGVIGVTTAYELTRDGHEVTVFDRRATAAEETSFANAGIVAPGYVAPWAAPGMPGKVLGHLLGRHAPVRLSWPLGARELAWMWRWYRACKLDTYLANRTRMHHLANYSLARLQQITQDLKLEFDRQPGYMVLLRSEADYRLAQPGLLTLRDLGVPFTELDATGARQLEPALNPDTALAGAIHLPHAQVANCRQFVLMLKNETARLGAQLRFNTSVDRIHHAPSVALSLAGEPRPHQFDQVVVCAGVQCASLLQAIGLELALIPVYGYALSATLRDPLQAPHSAVMDERYKVSISRLGQRIRVAGSAELGGTPERMRPGSIQTLHKVLQDWFPGAGQLSNGVQVWKGARPMLPDGPPVIGASGQGGVWLNLGHGSSGWALACGSARVLADLIAGRSPEVDMVGFGLNRERPGHLV
ncbi:D-amino acid dehydrogenase [Rhodoferax sp.]|uniref:D-amino acid dehydrogenase n=1 Tax=Rhodoferax sp. TaxID=50421 RepID=UPI002745AB29|nr:D-amino acid dehydrogenase [Rhodoferax sp.]